MKSPVANIQTGTCGPCGKFAYRTRRDAKAAMRALYPGGRGGMNAYPCQAGTGMGHFGHYGRHRLAVAS